MKPSRNLLILALAWCVLGLIIAFFPALASAWVPLGMIIAALMIIDALGVMQKPKLTIERQLSKNLPVDTWHNVQLIIHNNNVLPYQLQVFDLHPSAFLSQNLPQHVTIAPEHFAQLSYRLLPTQRGDALFPGVDIKIQSRLGLWIRRRSYHLETRVKVYPNFSEVAKYAILATDNKLSQLGVRLRQRRGQGLEFHQLREYREGDSIRQIDWKATSRYRRLISREYQDERDQHIVFLIDCSRRMQAKDGNLSHFDQCLNAMLLLSYVALRQGDAVSFMTFGGINRKFNARKGVSNVNSILNQTYDLQPTQEVSDYTGVARELLQHQRKRSLVVVLTNARDEDHDNIQTAMHLLRSRHLVLLANLREEILDKVIQEPVNNFDQAIRYASTLNYLGIRNKNHESLCNSGVLALNVSARELPIAMVNRYLDIKQSNLL